MNNKILLTLIFSLLTLSFFSACGPEIKQKPLPENAKITRTDKNMKSSERLLSTAGFFGVHKRYSYSYYYDKNGNETGGKMVEEITFDKKGNRIEHIKYEDEEVDIKFVFEYENDKLSAMRSYNAFDEPMIEKKYIYDEQGRNIKINEKDYYDPKNTKYHTLIYKDSLLVEKEIDNYQFTRIVHEIFDYDSLGYQIAEHKSDPNIGQFSIYYVYDEMGNLKEVVAPFYKFVYQYDEMGNIIQDELLTTESRQHKFLYNRDDNGLIQEKVRYDLEEKIIFLMKYKYDFY